MPHYLTISANNCSQRIGINTNCRTQAALRKRAFHRQKRDFPVIYVDSKSCGDFVSLIIDGDF